MKNIIKINGLVSAFYLLCMVGNAVAATSSAGEWSVNYIPAVSEQPVSKVIPKEGFKNLPIGTYDSKFSEGRFVFIVAYDPDIPGDSDSNGVSDTFFGKVSIGTSGTYDSPLTLSITGLDFTKDPGSTSIPISSLVYSVTEDKNGDAAVNLFPGVSINLHSPEVLPMPEPETYAMMLAGLGLINIAMRRRNKASYALTAKNVVYSY